MSNSLENKISLTSLIKYTFPTVIMMVFFSLSTIIDGIFVSRYVGANALSATNIVYPVINVLIGISIMFATGGNAIVAKYMGEGKNQEAKNKEAYDFIEEKLKEGKNVSFLTIGDPYVYSTYIHMLKHMEERGFHVETVPGITSFCAAASLVDRTLVVGDNPLMILPATRVKDIKDEKYVVIMKVYKHEETVVDFLEEKGFDYVYVSRAGREGQLILTDNEEIKQARDYMSLILASRE